MGDDASLVMNCGHVFHAGCMKEYVRRRSWTCPICKKPLVKCE
jgi:hypothetical protein